MVIAILVGLRLMPYCIIIIKVGRMDGLARSSIRPGSANSGHCQVNESRVSSGRIIPEIRRCPNWSHSASLADVACERSVS